MKNELALRKLSVMKSRARNSRTQSEAHLMMVEKYVEETRKHNAIMRASAATERASLADIAETLASMAREHRESHVRVFCGYLVDVAAIAAVFASGVLLGKFL